MNPSFQEKVVAYTLSKLENFKEVEDIDEEKIVEIAKNFPVEFKTRRLVKRWARTVPLNNIFKNLDLKDLNVLQATQTMRARFKKEKMIKVKLKQQEREEERKRAELKKEQKKRKEKEKRQRQQELKKKVHKALESSEKEEKYKTILENSKLFLETESQEKNAYRSQINANIKKRNRAKNSCFATIPKFKVRLEKSLTEAPKEEIQQEEGFFSDISLLFSGPLVTCLTKTVPYSLWICMSQNLENCEYYEKWKESIIQELDYSYADAALKFKQRIKKLRFKENNAFEYRLPNIDSRLIGHRFLLSKICNAENEIIYSFLPKQEQTSLFQFAQTLKQEPSTALLYFHRYVPKHNQLKYDSR